MFLQSAQMDSELLLIDCLGDHIMRAAHSVFNKTEWLVAHLLFLHCTRKKSHFMWQIKSCT